MTFGRRLRLRFRALFARQDDPYRGGDLDIALRTGALLWLIGAAVTWLLLPLSRPDVAIGGWGWPVAIAMSLLGVGYAWWMLRVGLTWNQLLVTSYVAVGQVALLDWLAGGESTPYPDLFLLIALYAGALHPPRRVAGVLAAIAAGSIAPLLYATASAERLGQVGLRLLLLVALATLAAVWMQTVRAQRIALRERSDHAEHLAQADELTGLANRRAFVAAIGTEMARARRSGASMALVLADVDSFKRINDDHGHTMGDACLRVIAEAVRASVRPYDTCFRWGGDEFAVLLPETDEDEGEDVCRRITAAVTAHTDPDGRPLRITCAAAALQDGMSAEDLLAAADAALLRRKRATAAQR